MSLCLCVGISVLPTLSPRTLHLRLTTLLNSKEPSPISLSWSSQSLDYTFLQQISACLIYLLVSNTKEKRQLRKSYSLLVCLTDFSVKSEEN